MDDAETLSKLTAIMRDVLDEPSVTLTPDTTAADISGWDSMTNITFVVEVERQFSVKFKTAEIEEMSRVGDVIKLIAAKTKV